MDVSEFISRTELLIENETFETVKKRKTMEALLSSRIEHENEPLDPPWPVILENPNPRRAPRRYPSRSRYPKKS